MLKNYFIIALRQLRKNSGFSLLNMFGLALGLTCSILIMLWIEDEVSFDWYHKKYDNIYQVMENQSYEGKTYTFAATPGLLAEAMKKEMPEVVNSARTGWGERWLFTSGERSTYENGNYADPSFFDIFSYDFIYGNAKNVFPNDHSIIVTEQMSKKFFGDINPIGKYLKINNSEEFMVSGVIKDLPLNSTIKFNWMASFKLFEKQNDWYTNWGSNGMETFVELKPGADLASFNKKLYSFIKNKKSEASARPLLLPMKDWRLRNNFEDGKQAGGRIEYVKLFGIIGILLIIIACINFMNLSTARAQKRAKEVGVRKVMGAQRNSLMKQFIGESVIVALIATFIACLLTIGTLPFFNQLVDKKLVLGISDPKQWLKLISLALFCGLISGSYPSIYLSSFKPVAIFKGLTQGNSSNVVLIRKTLVVTQFVVSIVLIIATIVVYRQVEHVKNRQLGYNKNNLLLIEQKGDLNKNLEIIQQDLLSTDVVINVASSAHQIIESGSNTGGFNWEGKDQSKDLLITTDYVSTDYINTAGMQLRSGRNFNNAKHDSLSCIINETFANIITKKDPLNMMLNLDGSNYRIVGVVKNFIFNDMYKKPDPYILFCQPHNTSNLFIRISENANMEDALSKVEKVIKKNNPNYPFEYKFLDEEFNKRFKSEMLISKLSRLFATLTIIISCIGLFGLAAYTAERRTKEIGIRKVLGASVSNMVSLLSKDFLMLVLIAITIAIPIAWYMMSKWLEDYSYRIEIKWWIFALAGASAIVIALLTVSFQAVKAALANPVKSLRTE